MLRIRGFMNKTIFFKLSVLVVLLTSALSAADEKSNTPDGIQKAVKF